MAAFYQELEMPIPNSRSVFFVKTESLTDFRESFVHGVVGFSEGNEFLGRVE